MKTNAERQAKFRANRVTLTKNEALQLLALAEGNNGTPFDFEHLMSAVEKLKEIIKK